MFSLHKSLRLWLIHHSQKGLIQIQTDGRVEARRFSAGLLCCLLAFPWSLNMLTWVLITGITCSCNWQVWPVTVIVSNHILAGRIVSSTRGSIIVFGEREADKILHLWFYQLSVVYKELFLSESSLLFSPASCPDNFSDFKNLVGFFLLFVYFLKYIYCKADSASLYLCNLLIFFLKVIRSIENNIQDSLTIWSRSVWDFCWLSIW